MQRFTSNPPSRRIVPSKRVAALSPTPAPWIRVGTFDCENGRWKKSDFPIPSELVMDVMQAMAMHDGKAVIHRDVRADESESCFVVHMTFLA